MRVTIEGQPIPYPITVLRGKLRLSGVSYSNTETIISDILSRVKGKTPTEQDVVKLAKERLDSYQRDASERFDILLRYESLRTVRSGLPPIILVLEGGSATGKSMLSIPMILNLSATRIISTDTVRQVLRTVYAEKDYPELYCHTYQAYQFRQAGPKELDSVIRGYLAQCELIEPVMKNLVDRISREGADAVAEGVHIRPGALKDLGLGIIEIMVDPGEESHRAMFMTKHTAAKLKTVSGDRVLRQREFQATRLIQDYLTDQAKRAGVHVLKLSDYDEGEKDICNLVIESVRRILQRTIENK
jgi:2-phosphoglycerate kinase